MGMTIHEAVDILEEVKTLDDSMFAYSQAYNDALEMAIEALKAQEPVKPTVEHNPAGQPMWCCGNCGTTLFFKFPRQTDDEDERNNYRFCNYCGMKVKWEVGYD